MDQHFIFPIAREAASNIAPTASPTEVYQEVSIAIRRGIAEYQRRHESAAALKREWLQGFGWGMATLALGVCLGVVSIMLLLAVGF